MAAAFCIMVWCGGCGGSSLDKMSSPLPDEDDEASSDSEKADGDEEGADGDEEPFSEEESPPDGDADGPEDAWAFDGPISQEMLENYLSRAVSHQFLYTDNDPALLEDDIRMFTDIGAKFIGRASIIWDTPNDIDAFFEQAAATAAQAHAADPTLLLQAGLFETVDTGVNDVPVPAWAFEAYGRTPEERNFRYDEMLYPDGRHVDFWREGASVPDITRPEMQLWIYYRARRYIDGGFEAIHFGVVEFMAETDPGLETYFDLFDRVRTYAREHARRHWVLCDAHHMVGVVKDGHTLFDFLSYPLRVEEVENEPYQGRLVAEGDDRIYGRTLGGVTPGGWTAERLPYLVEVDNWGSSGQGGQNIGGIWIWGWDEIGWFARLSEPERNQWLDYAWNWVRQTDAYGHFQFPTRRVLADPVGEAYWYYANRPSSSCGLGFNQEGAIKAIWESR
ncbi:MAG: hypothetical protein C4523_20110 [Myxococcales bacterium]|nr:MAG: hypothetical protein C4523_20110 [Myxococcales bacterium]